MCPTSKATASLERGANVTSHYVWNVKKYVLLVIPYSQSNTEMHFKFDDFPTEREGERNVS